MQYIGSLEASEKHISAKIFKENLHTSVSFAEPCRKNPADLHRFAKIENLGR